jgi:gluconate 2-dehydrogenase gamma chain
MTAVGAVTVIPAAALLAAAASENFAAPRPSFTGGELQPRGAPYRFFSAAEAAFIEAACERLIPADVSGPGALGAGVPHYLDRQLDGAWGSGKRLYRCGPWQPGTPSHGCQLPLTPGALFHTALRAINRDFAARGRNFSELSAGAQDAYLGILETGGVDLDGVPSAVFFDMLLKMTVEGFFSDPVHGASREVVAWRIIGFPGAYAGHSSRISSADVTIR